MQRFDLMSALGTGDLIRRAQLEKLRGDLTAKGLMGADEKSIVDLCKRAIRNISLNGLETGHLGS
jgi:hypothetical protein